ncbi:HigA family addiction module antitoxin [Methylobacterium sp. 77]|uniref:HigA family addiction module antitoxin n=1 Tax=Methylobacterium sp. 77 TaxID=1101192 RepID=UPI0003A4A8D1|nr:HigA family addiction module antitoxin [Methylobacterium sp. 77]
MPLDDHTEAVLPPMHPGEVLREEFMVPLGLSAGKIARACGVPRTRIERIAAEEIGISTDTALRLGRFFKTSPDLWINLQKQFEIESLFREIGADIERITPFEQEAA